MRSQSARGGSLASTIIAFALLMVALTVVVGSFTALWGVYDLAQREVSARHSAYLGTLVSDIASRLQPSGRLVSRSITVAIHPQDGAVDRVALAAQFDTGVEYVDRLKLLRRDGSIVSAYPMYRAPHESIPTSILLLAGTEEPLFAFERGEQGRDEHLWVARAVPGHQDLVMAARVRSGFIQQIVDGSSDVMARRYVSLSTEDGQIFADTTGLSAPNVDTIVYEAGEVAGVGTVAALMRDGTAMWGHYADITQFDGLRWRVATLEPRAAVFEATVRAIVPAVLALISSGLFSLLIATAFARRIVAPLTSLEARAREAVTGAYVQQLSSDRTDEVGRLAEAFNAIAVRLNALHDLSQLLASSSRLDQVLDGIVATIGHIVDTDDVAVFLIDDQAKALTLARSCVPVEGSCPVAFPLTSDAWLVERAYASGPEVRVMSADEVSQFMPGEYESQAAVMTVPLILGTDPLGVVVALRGGDATFTDAETEMVRTFSAQAAVAVRNSRLFEIETRSRTEAELLRNAAEQLSRPLALASTLRSVRETASTLLGASANSMAVFDRKAFGLGPPSDPAREADLLDAWRRSVIMGRPTVQLDRDSSDVARAFLERFEARRALLVHVEFDGDPCAVLAFARREDRPFTARDHRLAAALASQMALAFESVYHFERARSRAESLETIFRISQVVSSSLQVKVVLNRVLDVVQRVFEADAVALMTYDTDAQRIRTEMARGLVSAAMLHYECEPGVDVPGAVFSRGEPAYVDDLSSRDTELAALAYDQGMRSMVAVPLLARGRSIGVLNVFSKTHSAFTDEEIGLLHTFALQAALAIDTAKVYGKEHHIATVLQSSILPQRLPEFDGIELSSVYLPAGTEADIGGDYYDVFRGPDGEVYAVIGDVCGKGVVAATKTSMVKYTVRGLVAAGLGPARVLSEVNSIVSSGGDTSDIVTLWIAAIDLSSGSLTYASGGHPPALLRRSDGTIERLPPTGALLGAARAAPYTEERLAISVGDMLLLYTDGVTEARRGNKFFGEGRIHTALKRGESVAHVAEELVSSLQQFVVRSHRDDAAILVIRVTGGTSET